MSRWNQAPLPRDQLLLIPLTLDERIPQDHPVRLFGEMLDGLDWWGWEQHYGLVAGQPPIHPKILAGALLYGLTHGVRSSRRLEWACAHAVDFLWLVEGRTIDHSTFCEFRTRFRKELKDLKKRQAHLRKVLQAAPAADAQRKGGSGASRRSAKVPVADPRAPVAEVDWPKLPRCPPSDKLDRAGLWV